MQCQTNDVPNAIGALTTPLELQEAVLSDLIDRRKVKSIERMHIRVSELAGFHLLVEMKDGRKIAIAIGTVEGDRACALSEAEDMLAYLKGEILPNFATHAAALVYETTRSAIGRAPMLRHLAISRLGELEPALS